MFPLDHFQMFPMPKPIIESQDPQSFCSLPKIPIRDFGKGQELLTLKPSLLQYGCNEGSFMSDIHSALPAFVAR